MSRASFLIRISIKPEDLVLLHAVRVQFALIRTSIQYAYYTVACILTMHTSLILAASQLVWTRGRVETGGTANRGTEQVLVQYAYNSTSVEVPRGPLRVTTCLSNREGNMQGNWPNSNRMKTFQGQITILHVKILLHIRVLRSSI